MDIIDNFFDESLLSEEEKREVQRIAGQYNGLDIDLFISRIGGSNRIDEMRKINEMKLLLLILVMMKNIF